MIVLNSNVTKKEIPAIYELDEEGEAYNLHYFCSEECRADCKPGDFIEPTRHGMASTAGGCDGTVCETCGIVVIQDS